MFTRRLWGALLLLVPLLLATAGFVWAGTQGSNCIFDSSRVLLWENVIGDSGGENDNYWKCSSDSNLSVNDDHTLPGQCAALIMSDTWNDCVSSYTVYVPSGQKFCLYADDIYRNLKTSHTGPIGGYRYDVGAGWNDQLTSFRWVSSTSSC